MADKILNTRILLKYDTLAKWQSGPFNGADSTKWLKKGELAIVTLGTDVEVNHPTDNANQHPLLFKVGTGVHKFDDLLWASALAADVYDWAKKATPDWNDFSEIPGAKLNLDVNIEGAGNAITNASWDSTTKKITLTKGETFATKKELEDVIAAAITVEAGAKIEVAQDSTKYTVSHEAIAKAEEGKTVADRTYITGVTTDGYGHITGYTTATEEDQDLSNYKTKQTAVEATENDGTKTVKISQNENGEITVEQVDIAFPEVDLSDYAKTTDVPSIKVNNAGTADKVANTLTVGSKTFDGSKAVAVTAGDLGLESAMHFVGAFSEAPETATNGDVYLNTATKKEYVYSNGWVELGDEGSYALKTITITGVDGLAGGGDLSANRTIGLSEITKASLAKADTALQAADITGKADKVINATADNFAGLDANGNLTDSGKKATDFDAAGTAQGLIDALGTMAKESKDNYYTKVEADSAFMDSNEVNTAITNELANHAGIDKVGTVTSVGVAEGFKNTGSATDPVIDIIQKGEEGAVTWIFDCGGAE